MAEHSRVVVLGIDGVPHSLMTRMMAAGDVPALARLAEEHGMRQMDSTHPTVSSVAWTTYATGRQSGQHGIYGFVDRTRSGYDIAIPQSTSVACETIWEILSRAGKRVFVMNVPMTYPPRRVNGVLIGGFLSSNIYKAAHPASAAAYLRRSGYIIDSDPTLGHESKQRLLANINETLDRRVDALFHFLGQEDWDYVHAHVMATDRLHHFMLGSYEDGVEPLASGFVELYRKLDGVVGRLVDALSDDCALMVLSDHGFCPIESEVNLARYLVERGWTSVRGERADTPLAIDPATSRAYTLIPGRVHLNVAGREPGGIVDPADYLRLRDELAAVLAELEAQDGSRIIRSVMKREELYWPEDASGPTPDIGLDRLLSADGPYGRAPDLVAVPEDGYDLKMGLEKDGLFERTAIEGMHTYDDALVISRGVPLPETRFSIRSLARRVLDTIGVEAPPGVD
jgi:predicted AlkP superfamily phosphohydrolase/phosphomutase